MVIWLIGLSGSGKTTIGTELYNLYRQKFSNTVFLDGDILRDVWGDNLGHDLNGRSMNAHRISKLCYILDNQNINVVACVLSIFPKWQIWNRNNFKNYKQIYLYSPISFLTEQDDKGLYEKANKGSLKNVVGIDLDFPEPVKSDIIIDNSIRNESPHDIAVDIFERIV